MEAIYTLDFAILHWIMDHIANPFLDVLMPLITLLGEDGIFWIAVALVLLIIPRTRKTGAMMGVAMLLGFLIGNMLMKPGFARLRPYDNLAMGGREVTLLVQGLSDFSFPSGHTLCCFEASTVLMLRYPKPWGIIALVSAILVAFSRLYLYVHYPTDVLVGMIMGIAFGFAAVAIVNAVVAARQKKHAQDTFCRKVSP